MSLADSDWQVESSFALIGCAVLSLACDWSVFNLATIGRLDENVEQSVFETIPTSIQYINLSGK